MAEDWFINLGLMLMGGERIRPRKKFPQILVGVKIHFNW